MNTVSQVLNSYAFLTEDLKGVHEVIKESLTTGNERMDGLLARFTAHPGKMLRPAMVILSSRFAEDFDAARMYRLAAAVEILHIATLVHDDIVDESPLRRGVATFHTTEGTRKAVLLGDFLFTRCFRLISDFASPEAASLLAVSVSRICESEIEQSRDNGLSRRAYLRNIAGKTALLFVMSLSVGAMESGASDSIVGTLREVGYGLGMSFQIIDDILDYEGPSSGMGKPVGNDVRTGVKTLPLILASLEGGLNAEKMLKKPLTKRRVLRLRQAVSEAGGPALARDAAHYYDSMAMARIQTLPEVPARDALRDLLTAISGRGQ